MEINIIISQFQFSLVFFHVISQNEPSILLLSINVVLGFFQFVTSSSLLSSFYLNIAIWWLRPANAYIVSFCHLGTAAKQKQSLCQRVLRSRQGVRRHREGGAQLSVHRGERAEVLQKWDGRSFNPTSFSFLLLSAEL